MQKSFKNTAFKYYAYLWKGLFCLMVVLLITNKESIAQKGKAFTLEINGLVVDDDSRRTIDGAIVKLTDNKGKLIQTITTTGNGKFRFTLDPDKEYLISAGKPGYTGKIVSVSTVGVYTESNTLDYYKFPMSIGIFKEVPDLDVSVLEKPIGEVFYNQTMKEFDYNADKFMRGELEKMAKEIEKKKKEEAERLKREQEELKNKAKRDAKEAAEAAEAARKRAAEEEKERLKREAREKAEAEAEAKRRLAEEEALKKKSEQDAKRLAEEEAKRKAQEAAEALAAKKKAEQDAIREEAEAAKAKAAAEAEARAQAKREAEEAEKAKAAAAAEAEFKRREAARLQAEEEARQKAELKAQELAQRRAEAEARLQAAEEAKKIYVKFVDYDSEEGTNCFISKTIVTLTTGDIIVYRKITYTWGGLYYKKDNADISQESFIQELKNIVIKTD